MAQVGAIHGDLHTNNILVEFSRSGKLNNFVLIDFAYLRKKEFLFFDQMYLELSLLLDQFQQGSLTLNDWHSLINILKNDRIPNQYSDGRLSEIIGVVNSGRVALNNWIEDDPNRHTQKDDLWLQIALASVAAGLNYFKKKKLSKEIKWAAMCYAAAHLEIICQQLDMEKPSQCSRFGMNDQITEEEVTKYGIWQSFESYCENFSHEYLYILVLGPNQNSSKLAPIGRVRWSVVLDFDSNLKNTSLKYLGDELSQICAMHLVTKEVQNEINYVPLRAAYWYAANGISDENSLDKFENVKEWAKSYIGSVRSFLQKVSQVSSHMPVRCVVCWDNIEFLERIVTMLGEEIFAERIKFAFVSTSDISEIKKKVTEGEYFNISTEYLASAIGNLLATQNQSAQVLLPAGIEKDSNSTAIIEVKDTNWIDENFSIIHMNIGQKERSNNPTSQFYRGGVIDWFGLRIDADVRRTITETIQENILSDLESRATVQYNLFHSPGGGGTTVARRIAWNIHKNYPVLVMKRYASEAISCIEYIFQKTQRSILVIIDRTVGVTPEILQAFYTELKFRHLPVVTLVLVRSHSIENPTKRRIHLSESLDTEESQRFYESYKVEAPEKIEQLNDLLHIESFGYSKKLLTPFYFGLFAFEKEFQQLDSYINEKLTGAREVERQTMLYLALAELYSKLSVPAQYFGKLAGLPSESSVSLQNILSRGQQKLLIFDPDENSWKVSHYLIAEEIRNQILDPSPNHNLWKNNLATWLCQFIDYFASISSENELPNKFIMDLMFQIFVDREQGGVEDLNTGKFQKLVFSPLVMEIHSRVSAELHEEGGLIVLKRLTESFSNPHFQAHYARRLSHNGDHVSAIREALKAVIHEKAKTDYKLWHIYGTVIKRYKDEITRQYLKEYEITDNILTSKARLDEINNLFSQASNAFNKSLSVEKNEFAYISLISLLIKQIEFYHQISGIEKIQEFLQKNPDYLEMLEQAEGLLDESKYVIRNYEANKYFVDAQNMIKIAYGDFDDIIKSWRELLSKGVAEPAPIRRSLVRALLQSRGRDWDNLGQSDLDEVLKLMGQNFLDDEKNSRSNIKLWFNAARRSTLDINSAIERIRAWTVLDEDSLEAQYYLYISYVIKSFDEPSTKIRENAEKIILQLSKKSMRADIYDPNFSYNLLGIGKGLKRLVFYKKLGSFNEENWGKNEQGQDLLYRANGSITNLAGPTKGEITLDINKLKVHFTPGHIRRLSDGSQSEPFLRGRDLNADVTLHIGFTYNGLRAFDVIRK